MADTTTVVLVVGAIGTLLAFASVLVVLVQRLRRAYGEATRVLERIKPVLDGLADQHRVTRRELERVSHAVETLDERREARRRP